MNIENYDEMLSQIIKMTIKGEEHLGKNLKKECIEYIEKLEAKVGE